jgi:hypothetical protein
MIQHNHHQNGSAVEVQVLEIPDLAGERHLKDSGGRWSRDSRNQSFDEEFSLVRFHPASRMSASSQQIKRWSVAGA